MLNISKRRTFYNIGDNNPYHTYTFSRKERGNYVNVWFPNPSIINKSALIYLLIYNKLLFLK